MTAITQETAPAEVGGWLRPRVFTLSILAAIAAGAAAALTFFVPDILTGPAVSNGNARGTALVMILVALPVLAVGMWRTRAGSWRAPFAWLGALFYLAYNLFLFLFLTPFNSLFLLYVAAESLTIFAIFALFHGVDREALVGRMGRVPVKGLALFVWTIVALNLLAWLRVVIPAVFAADPTSFLDGLGVATNAIYVQDLVFWLPFMTVAAWWMWRGRADGIWLTGSWLAFGAIEGIGIAADQWFGHQADPLSPHASTEVIPAMIGLALLSLAGLFFYLRGRTYDRPNLGEVKK